MNVNLVYVYALNVIRHYLEIKPFLEDDTNGKVQRELHGGMCAGAGFALRHAGWEDLADEIENLCTVLFGKGFPILSRNENPWN